MLNSNSVISELIVGFMIPGTPISLYLQSGMTDTGVRKTGCYDDVRSPLSLYDETTHRPCRFKVRFINLFSSSFQICLTSII